MSSAIIQVYDRISGVALGEINNAHNIDYSFGLSKSGQRTFDLPVNHPKATRELLDYGNILVIYSSNAGTWSGHIAIQDWNTDTLTITRYSAEMKLANRRLTPIKFDAVPYGVLVKHIVDTANLENPTGINVGDLWMGGPKVQMDIGIENPYQKLAEITGNTFYDYRVLMLRPGDWELDFYESLGSDLTDRVGFVLGYDTDGAPEYKEDWTNFCNQVTAVGREPQGGAPSAYSDGWKNRPKAVYRDETSISVYGLVEDIIEVSDIEDVPTLFIRRQQEVWKRAHPLKTRTFVLSERRDLWGQFQEGDYVAVQIPYLGFGGVVVPLRITGREVKEDTDQMAVTGDVIQDQRALNLKMYTGAHYG